MIRRFSKLMVMANRNHWKWKLQLTVELALGECMYDVTAWERAEDVTLGSRPEPGRRQSHSRRDPDLRNNRSVRPLSHPTSFYALINLCRC
jgi:hypothetical protein